ncbi:MAG: hypothetical protein WD045_17980 [Pirellulaceae bacterium]
MSRISPTSRNLVLGLALGLLALSGCRTDPSIDLLESELRQLEDTTYTLNDTIRQRDQQLESIRRENATLRRRLGMPGVDVNFGAEEFESDEGSSDVSLPVPSRGRRSDDSVSHSELPTIEMGDSSESPEAEEVAPRFEPTPARTDSLISLKEDHLPDDMEVVSIHLNPRLTGGWDMDRGPGDDGIMVVIEPRNQAGQYVPVAAPVSVVLLDPAFRGEEAYVGRWDFDTADSAKHIEKTLLGSGIHLKLPWTAGPPEHSKLVLHVRYTTAEGTVLQQRKELKIDLPGEISSRWTPASGPLADHLPRAALVGHEEPVREPIPLRPKPSPSTAEVPEWKPYR